MVVYIIKLNENSHSFVAACFAYLFVHLGNSV